jgi:hypothetical protein
LSPYLFILCAEGLSALLQNAESGGKIEGIKVCRGAPRVNHLFFADDLLILMSARCADAQVLKNILNIYEQASGQVINKDKSSILFSPNKSNHVRQQISSILSISQEAKNERFWGFLFQWENQERGLLNILNIGFGLAFKAGRRSYCLRRARRLW